MSKGVGCWVLFFSSLAPPSCCWTRAGFLSGDVVRDGNGFEERCRVSKPLFVPALVLWSLASLLSREHALTPPPPPPPVSPARDAVAPSFLNKQRRTPGDVSLSRAPTAVYVCLSELRRRSLCPVPSSARCSAVERTSPSGSRSSPWWTCCARRTKINKL